MGKAICINVAGVFVNAPVSTNLQRSNPLLLPKRLSTGRILLPLVSHAEVQE